MIHGIEEIETFVGNWWVILGSEEIDHELTFRNFGNGPVVIDDSVYGPFDSEFKAEQWVADYLRGSK